MVDQADPSSVIWVRESKGLAMEFGWRREGAWRTRATYGAGFSPVAPLFSISTAGCHEECRFALSEECGSSLFLQDRHDCNEAGAQRGIAISMTADWFT